MLKIRLTRKGKKNNAFYRLVVAEHTSPIKGRFIEALGFLNPHTKEKNFKEDRVKYWVGKGAQCSNTAHNLLVGAGILNGPKRAIKMKKKEEETKPESSGKSVESEAKPVEEKTKEEAAENKTEEPKVAEEKKEEAPVQDEAKVSAETPKEEKTG